MKNEKLSLDHIRAALRTQEKRLKELLDHIELNEAGYTTIIHQITYIEDGLRRIRYSAA